MTESKIIICGHGSGKPRTANLKSYNQSRYDSFAPNGKRKGLVCIRRFKEMTDGGRKKFTAKYSEILGRNYYSQPLRQYVYRPYGNNYYSDCSSSLCATLQEIGYSVGLLNTAGIYNSALFETIPAEIKEGHITNPDCLKVGDFLLYRGENPERPEQIGHVEGVYSIPAEMPVYPIEATLTVTADSLNIRAGAGTSYPIVGAFAKNTLVQVDAKSGDWFRCSRGWISRKYVKGWIKEPQTDPRLNYWYIENGSYPMSIVRDINGCDFAFDKNGWMIEKERITGAGVVLY